MSVLVTLLVVVIVCAIIYWIITLLPLPAPFKNVAMVIVLLILLLWILNIFGFIGEPMFRTR